MPKKAFANVEMWKISIRVHFLLSLSVSLSLSFRSRLLARYTPVYASNIYVQCHVHSAFQLLSNHDVCLLGMENVQLFMDLFIWWVMVMLAMRLEYTNRNNSNCVNLWAADSFSTHLPFGMFGLQWVDYSTQPISFSWETFIRGTRIMNNWNVLITMHAKWENDRRIRKKSEL